MVGLDEIAGRGSACAKKTTKTKRCQNLGAGAFTERDLEAMATML